MGLDVIKFKIQDSKEYKTLPVEEINENNVESLFFKELFL